MKICAFLGEVYGFDGNPPIVVHVITTKTNFWWYLYTPWEVEHAYDFPLYHNVRKSIPY